MTLVEPGREERAPVSKPIEATSYVYLPPSQSATEDECRALLEDAGAALWITGGDGVHSFEREQPSAVPGVFEAGTANVAGIAGLDAGIKQLLDGGVAADGLRPDADRAGRGPARPGRTARRVGEHHRRQLHL